MNKTTKWYAKPLYMIMALALVAGLTLVPVMVPTLVPVAGPTVEANSVSGITVRMGNTTPACTSNCTINFTTTVNLTKLVDTITIDFPAHTGATGNNTTVSSITAAATWVNGTVASSVTIGGQRVSITPSVNVTAGSVTVVFGNTTAPITNPDPEGSYTLTVYTSQETTPVTSAVYVIDSMIAVGTIVVANTSVNTLSQYTIPITVTTALAQYDTITITFPGTTTVPTSINAGANITINGTALISAANYTGDNTTKTVTLGVPAAPGTATWNVVFTQGALLKNPITINSSYWRIWAYTSKDRGPNQSATYSTTTGNQSGITQVNWSTHDDYIANNTCGATSFSIETLDVNGALCNVSAATTFVLDGGDGSFYSNSDCSSAIGTIDIAANWHNSSGFYYKCSTPGTQNISVRDLNGSWTRDNQSIIVNPMVQLWGGGVIVGNYTTIATAEAAALPYDTIKVLPSTYALSSTLQIDVPHLTIESTGGADSTIIYGESGTAVSTYPIDIKTQNVTIDGFTIKGNDTTGQYGIYIRYGGFTIQNCRLSNYTQEYIFVESTHGAITSGLIHNNTLIGNGTGAANYRGGIWLETYSNNDISNITISNNTLSNFGAKNATTPDSTAINIGQTGTGEISNITITGNTVTDSYCGFCLWNSVDHLNGTHAIANNTFSECFMGVNILGDADPNVVTFTMQDNTITNNTYYGIYLHDATRELTGTATIKHNDLSGNGVFGIYNSYATTTTDPVASYNYWGNETGPGNGTGTLASNATGSGSNVSENVTYSPWLDAPYPGGNTTYSSSITLQKNWNFISVPKKLSNATFGFLLSGQNISASYSYDPGTGWTLLNNSSPVAVLEAYWVDANAAGIINLTYVITGQEVPASKDLTGKKWNAIGFSDVTADSARDTLESINGSWSNVLGWNATSQDYDAAILWPGASTDMNPGKGYWVWMTANDTLSALS